MSQVSSGTLAALLLVPLLTCCDQSAPSAPAAGVTADAKDAATSTDTGTCDSSRHESSSLDGVYTFDLDCALTYLAEAGCDFSLDPDGDGRALHSSIIEDLQNDSAACQSGLLCSGCADSDSVATHRDLRGSRRQLVLHGRRLVRPAGRLPGGRRG